ncbi:Ras guanine nucleotide exchange factor A, variant 2 [Balamuthia mandrillaris]
MASAESPSVPPSSNEQFSTDEGEELSPLKRTIAQRQLQKRGSRRTIRPFSKNSSLEELLSSASSSSSSPTIDRSKWKVKAFRNNPELNNLRERLNPLSRAVSFARTYNDTTLQQLLNDSKEENQAFSGGLSATLLQESSVLDPEKVLLLIHQHLKYAGLKQAARVLEKERPHLRPAENQGTDDESRLQSLLKLAMKDAERVWDLSINERAQMGQLDDELEEHLNDLEMLEEEIFQKGTNMWQTNDTGPLKAENELGIQAASLNKLVETLTSEKHADQSFIKTFLMTYRTFTTPEKLLMKLIERYKVPIDQKPKDMDLEKWNMHVSSIRLRVCRVLKKWVDEYLEDELHSLRFIKALLDFLETLKRDEQVFAKIAAKVLESLNRQLTSNEPPKKKIFPEPPPEPRVPRNVFSPKLSLMDIHDEELARQLTLAEFQIFSCIKPRELLNLSWSKPKQRHRSPNVLKMIRYFNDVSTWVYSCVVQCDRLRNRARIMLKFLKLTEVIFPSFFFIILYSSSLHSFLSKTKWNTNKKKRNGTQTIELA